MSKWHFRKANLAAMKGRKRLEARKLVNRLLQTLLAETMSLSQNKAMGTGKKVTNVHVTYYQP